jgi:hypothetical protein
MIQTCLLKKLKAATQNEQNDGGLIVKNRPFIDQCDIFERVTTIESIVLSTCMTSLFLCTKSIHIRPFFPFLGLCAGTAFTMPFAATININSLLLARCSGSGFCAALQVY